MIEVRRTTEHERLMHGNLEYAIDLGKSQQFYNMGALMELYEKLEIVINDHIARNKFLVCDHKLPNHAPVTLVRCPICGDFKEEFCD